MGDEDTAMLEDEGTGGGGALSALTELANPPANPEAQKYATQILKQTLSGSDLSGEQSLLRDFTANADAAKTALQTARQRLMALNITPDERRFAVASAFLSPTRTGNFGDSLANWARSRYELAREGRELDSQKLGEELGLDQREEGIDQNLLNAKLRLQELHETQQGNLAGRALQVLARPTTPFRGYQYEKGVDIGNGKKQDFLFDPAGGTRKPIGQPYSDTGAGDPILAKQIADYDAPPISGYALTRPGSSGQATMDMVYTNRPTYDASLWPQIVRTRNDFAAGKDATKMASMERALLHLHTLDQAVDAMHNGNIQELNKIANTLGVHLNTNDAPAVFSAIQGIVASELSTAVQATSGVTERQANEQRLSRDFAAPITHDITKYYQKLLGAQFETLRDQWHAGMGLANFDEGTPEYVSRKNKLDREFYEHVKQPYVRSILTPAPAQAVADLSNPALLKAHPDLPAQFKAAYGYLPSELQ